MYLTGGWTLLGIRLVVGTGGHPHVCSGCVVGSSDLVAGLGSHVFLYISLGRS